MKRPHVTFNGTVEMHGSASYIVVPIDPKALFGRVRAPVKVTLNGYTFRSTIAAMGGPPAIPLRASNREAARVKGGQTVEVRLDLDDEPRVVTPPADLVTALKAAPPAWDRWRELSFSHQREHAEAVADAKKPETRARRIEKAVEMLKAATPKASRKPRP
jgi:hypothetical protein